MQLLIDTTKQGLLVFELLDHEKMLARLEKEVAKLSENLLVELEKFMQKRKVKLRDLDKILVNPGPGGFSTTRTGVATANALAHALEIPVGEWPSGKVKDIILPKYDKMPNITKPRP